MMQSDEPAQVSNCKDTARNVVLTVLDNLLDEYQALNGDLPFAAQYRDEALFGFTEIEPILNPSMTVLEIGAGTGLLAYLAAQKVEKLDALEPLGIGFETFEGLLAFIAAKLSPDLIPLNERIEQFDKIQHYDFIYSVNVFEHVDDWRQAIKVTHRALKPGGKAVILIPNYNVPYEPHFGLPLVGSKELTRKIFWKRIAHHEVSRNAEGLWKSLNCIRASQLQSFCRSEGIEISFDRGIMGRMLARVFSQPTFAQRHQILAPILRLFHARYFTTLFNLLPIRLQPYVKVIITKAI